MNFLTGNPQRKLLSRSWTQIYAKLEKLTRLHSVFAPYIYFNGVWKKKANHSRNWQSDGVNKWINPCAQVVLLHAPLNHIIIWGHSSVSHYCEPHTYVGLFFCIIYFYYLLFHRRPTHYLCYLSYRPFGVNATFPTGLIEC